MERYGMVIGVKEKKLEEYKQLHYDDVDEETMNVQHGP